MSYFGAEDESAEPVLRAACAPSLRVPRDCTMSTLLNSLHLPPKGKPSTASPSLDSPASFRTSQPSPQPPTLHAVDPTVIRSLIFGGSLSVQVVVAEDDLPPNADRAIDSYYLEAPRMSYLPLLLSQIRKGLLDLILDNQTSAALSNDSLWFSYNGAPLRWHWPIGLLYDYHADSGARTHARPESRSSSLIDSHRAAGRPSISSITSTSTTSSDELPWKITLHLKDPPSDALLMGSSVEACRNCYMNMIKQADYVRWGNVKRVTNMRKEQQDALWEGVVAHDFDRYWAVAAKLIPSSSAPSPTHTRSSTPASAHSSSGQASDSREAGTIRSVPLRVYLPEGAPILQELVPPIQDNSPTTLHTHLSKLVPLFFPSGAPPLVVPILHGVQVPLDAEVAWLGSCMAGADGWVNVVLKIDVQ